MSKIISFIRNLFSKNNKIESLFKDNNKPVLAEVGGNYCSDVC